MIVKQVGAETGYGLSRISDLISYVLTAETDDGSEKCLVSDCLNLMCAIDDPERVKAEFMALATSTQIPRAANRSLVRHWILAFNDREKPSPQEVLEAGKLFVEQMGLSEHQVVLGVHVNTENIHVHLAVATLNPLTGKSCNNYNDVIKAHAVLSGIENAMGAEPERNAMFKWRYCGGNRPNPDYKPRNSISFAYMSPEAVVVKLPHNSPDPEFADMRKKDNCWYYKGYNEAGVIRKSDTLYFFNWAYRDTISEIKKLKENGAMVIVQRELVPLFLSEKASAEKRKDIRDYLDGSFQNGDVVVFTGADYAALPDDPNLAGRVRPPVYPLEVRKLRHGRNPWKYYNSLKLKYEKKLPPVRVKTMVALHMRAHSIPRSDIEECLRRDGMDAPYAKHVTRWLYSSRGNMELFRQREMGILVMEPETKLKKTAPKPKKSMRLRIGHYGQILVGDEKEHRLRYGANLNERTTEIPFHEREKSENRETEISRPLPGPH